MGQTVSVVTVGCGRNEVDSDELAARLTEAGWQLSPDGAVVVVNTCGFIESARNQSLDALLDAASTGAKVVAVGCMAERYGKDLAEALPEAAAVLSFDDYPDIAARLTDVLAGAQRPAHTPSDRRRLLPIAPVKRAGTGVPGHGQRRHRLGSGPVAPLKLASGCDRRCTFCAIPRFRGAFVSRPPDEIVAEAEWLAGHEVREVLLVSENTTSYGKDLGDLLALEKLLPRLAAVVDRVRVSYLQPAELRPSLIEAIAATPGVVPYFEVSFQHASGPVLRRMRRFGDRERFLELLDAIREQAPAAGFRSNFIAGFPGETEADFAELLTFVSSARLDAIGVFGYSDEEGTAAAGFVDKVDPSLVADRVTELSLLADQLCAQRAAERVGSVVEVLIGETGTGWAEHQGPADGRVTVKRETVRAGDLWRVRITGTHGVDLEAELA